MDIPVISNQHHNKYRDALSLRCDYITTTNNNNEEEDNKYDFYLYVMDISYFSGKMEMYCRYKELNCKRLEPTFTELFEIAQHVS